MDKLAVIENDPNPFPNGIKARGNTNFGSHCHLHRCGGVHHMLNQRVDEACGPSSTVYDSTRAKPKRRLQSALT